MDLFDLHCDTITECYKQNRTLENNGFAIDKLKSNHLRRWVETFAFFIPDELSETESYEYFLRLNDCYDKLGIKPFNGQKEDGLLGIKMIEGGKLLGRGNRERIEDIKNKGIRVITLTWNAENQIASGSQSAGGLKPTGKDIVKELEANNIIIDMSHLNEESFYDIIDISKRPKIATHSNAYSVFAHKRNLTDEQIREIKKTDGIVGLNFYPEFLGDTEKDVFGNLIKHAEHILKIGGEDVLAIGSDFDGAPMSQALNDISKTADLYKRFTNYFGCGLTYKIFYANAYEFYRNNAV